MAEHSFPNPKEVFATADSIWWSLEPEDWLEAFRAHPRIGENSDSQWSREEQHGARHASHETLVALREANHQYEDRFGFVFLICATGKTADQMLRALKQRLGNDQATEIRVSAGEQREITHLRLKRLLNK